MKQIKQLILSTVIALVSIVNSASAQSISAQPVELQTGGQTELVVSLTGATTMTALQFNLQLPVGMTARASSVILGPATNGHTFSVQVLDSGDMLFVIYSMDLKTFCDGELLRIPVNACNNEVNATGQFYNVRTATDKAVSHQCDNTSFSVKVTGTIYNLIYIVDGKEYKTYELANGATITPEPAPTKEGYTFSGWSEIPETMPAHDVTVTGTFSINKYKLTYIVDGAEYKTYEVEYNATITAEAEPTKEGYTFNGWSEIPSTMPPYDVTVTGTFNINSYKLTYMIDDKVYKEMMYEYGATIIPEPQPEEDYDTFEWIDLPQTMPAHDVVVYASYTSGIIEVLMTSRQNVRIYSPNGKKLNKLQKGINIIILDDGTIKKIVVR